MNKILLFLFFTQSKSVDLKYTHTYTPKEFLNSHHYTHLYMNISNNTHEHNRSYTYTPDDKLLKNHAVSFGESNIFSPSVIKSYNNIIGFNTTNKSNNFSNNSIIKTMNKFIIFLPILYYYYQNH